MRFNNIMSKHFIEIDNFLSNPDYVILLYGLFNELINRSINKGDNIAILQFDKPESLLRWLKSGGRVQIKMMFVPYKVMLETDAVVEKHRYVLDMCGVGKICIMITCLMENEMEAQCTATVMGIAVNPKLDNIYKKYPKHALIEHK